MYFDESGTRDYLTRRNVTFEVDSGKKEEIEVVEKRKDEVEQTPIALQG